MPSFEKAAAASVRAEFHAASISSSFQTTRIPLPPPPAVAFKMTGYLIFFAVFFASSTSLSKPSDPGIHGTPAAVMVALALALSPIPAICSGVAPINLMLCS